jgi:hypothetical protein
VRADRHVVDPESLEYRERLRVIARGDEDLMAGVAEPLDHGTENKRMRRGRHVDPDSHGRAA